MTTTRRATKADTTRAEPIAAPIRELPSGGSAKFPPRRSGPRLRVGCDILLCGIVSTMMSLQAKAAEAQEANPPRTEASAPAGKTGKERLGGKATDEQRVDNCKVPPAQWGPKTRPSSCSSGSSSMPIR